MARGELKEAVIMKKSQRSNCRNGMASAQWAFDIAFWKSPAVVR
jgi:hypothetical protein